MNKTTVVSLISGAIAVIPYLAMVFFYFLANNDGITEEIFAFVIFIMFVMIPYFIYFVSGIVFGLISFFAGVVSMYQISNNQGPETNFRLAISGIFLGILGIIANVIYIVILLFAMMMAD